MLELRAASWQDSTDVFAMLAEIGPGENGFGNAAFGLSFTEFKEYLRQCERQARGLGLTNGRVAQTTFWFYSQGHPVGVSKLRHELNDELRKHGGHIGYCIRPSERGKGYGSLILKKTLDEAHKLSLQRVLLTVHAGNIASRRVIEKNGGILETCLANEICLYWIALGRA